ncbi:MAG: hypothetical protein LBF72_03325 [Holosporales bacterium]|nr:hypothetical protein [Holosporales bacterium]
MLMPHKHAALLLSVSLAHNSSVIGYKNPLPDLRATLLQSPRERIISQPPVSTIAKAVPHFRYWREEEMRTR